MDPVDYLEECFINAFYINSDVHLNLFDVDVWNIDMLLKELKNLGYRIIGEDLYNGAVLLYIKNEYVFPVKPEDDIKEIYYFDKNGWSKDSVNGCVEHGYKKILGE